MEPKEAKTDVARLNNKREKSHDPPKSVGDQPQAGVNGSIMVMEMLFCGPLSAQEQTVLCSDAAGYTAHVQ